MAAQERPQAASDAGNSGSPDLRQRVIGYCEQRGLTLEEVARRAAMAPNYLRQVEEMGSDFDPVRAEYCIHAGHRPGMGSAVCGWQLSAPCREGCSWSSLGRLPGCSTVLLRLPYLALSTAVSFIRLLPMSNREKNLEILALRHQLVVLQRQIGKPQLCACR
jgi:hypothetical protein